MREPRRGGHRRDHITQQGEALQEIRLGDLDSLTLHVSRRRPGLVPIIATGNPSVVFEAVASGLDLGESPSLGGVRTPEIDAGPEISEPPVRAFVGQSASNLLDKSAQHGVCVPQVKDLGEGDLDLLVLLARC
ncbi:hypothetical protein [Aquisphaera insulae]|uniref:hypothetical protein n=1 Tax=Aquisphaera insulae TaxID=2712864 RepID=UPI0013EAFA10|nr:hypothetical protein [Aquisphaera insulae]